MTRCSGMWRAMHKRKPAAFLPRVLNAMRFLIHAARIRRISFQIAPMQGRFYRGVAGDHSTSKIVWQNEPNEAKPYSFRHQKPSIRQVNIQTAPGSDRFVRSCYTYK